MDVNISLVKGRLQSHNILYFCIKILINYFHSEHQISYNSKLSILVPLPKPIFLFSLEQTIFLSDFHTFVIPVIKATFLLFMCLFLWLLYIFIDFIFQNNLCQIHYKILKTLSEKIHTIVDVYNLYNNFIGAHNSQYFSYFLKTLCFIKKVKFLTSLNVGLCGYPLAK